MTKILSYFLLITIIITFGVAFFILKIDPLNPIKNTHAWSAIMELKYRKNIAATASDPFPKDLPRSVKSTPAYTIILVGDSMTEFLGQNPDALRKHLKDYYGDKVFGIFNLGFGSTNVLSLPDRIQKESTHSGQTFASINSREFDLIIIESFGNNPLSEFPLQEGLKKQNEMLDQSVKLIHTKHPKAVIAFLATIAPIRNRYGEGAVVLSPEKRREWADERIAYIKNHIKFAQDHNIPLINIFEKSLTKDGDGNIDYINTNDFIHPSVTGIDFISKEIADWIFQNKVLPL